jgi:uncharacterized membrane protein
MWIAYVLATIVFYVGLDFFLKKAAGRIDDFWGSVVINAVSTLPALVFVIFAKLSNKEILVTKDGLIFSILAGLSIGIGTITFIKMFATGTNLSIGSPLVRIGIILGATLVGIFVLRETLSPRQMVGIAMSILGLGLLMFK